MRLLCFAVIISFISCKEDDKGRYERNSNIDSLKYYLQFPQTNQNNERALKYLRSTAEIQNTGELFALANRFHYEENTTGFKEVANLISKQAQKLKDSISLAKVNVYFAEYYKLVGINDSSFFFYLKAEKLYRKLEDFPNLADVYVRKADLQSNQNDFLGTEKSAFEALAILRDYPNPPKEYEAYNLIGISSIEFNNHQKAIEYYNRALSETKKLERKQQIYLRAISLNNIGNAYERMKDYKRAISYFEQALSSNGIKENYPDFYATLIDNIAYSEFKLGDLSRLPGLFFEALSIRRRIGVTSKIVLSCIHISEYYERTLENEKAILYAKQALDEARKINYPTDVLSALKQISTVDLKNASYYSNLYIRINDSIQQVERKNKDRFARIQYETDEIALENDKLAEQNRNLLYFFVGSLMIGLLLFVIRTQRARNRELLLKQAQQKANEDIYNLMISQQNMIEESRIKEKKRIAQELHDGVLGRLFGTRLNLDSLNKMNDEASLSKRNEYLSELKNIEQDIREISHDLNREKYALINNFLAILNNLLEEQRASFEVSVESVIEQRINWDEIEDSLKINLYRILQESLQNINKYAKATKIKIDIIEEDDNISLRVADNGVGFDVDLKRRGIGLQNMLARATELGGTLDLKSKKGKGTTLYLRFPIRKY